MKLHAPNPFVGIQRGQVAIKQSWFFAQNVSIDSGLYDQIFIEVWVPNLVSPLLAFKSVVVVGGERDSKGGMRE